MIFEEIHSKILTIATKVTDEDTLITVVPRKCKKNTFYGNIPNNINSILQETSLSNKNAIQLSLFTSL